jgi:hypothetical protein
MDDFSPENVEGRASVLYERAGLDDGEQARSSLLTERLLGRGTVRLVHAAALPGVAALARVGPEWRIYVRASAPPQLRDFAILHELGHWSLGVDATEEHCDALAAALLLPRRAYLRAARELGPDWPALAECFGCSESAVSLRWGEVVGEPLALVAPSRVRVRGPAFSWPAEERAFRALARAPRPGLVAARLHDDQRRVVLSASLA